MFNSLLSISACTPSVLTTVVIGSSNSSAVRFLAGIGMSFLNDSSEGKLAASAEGLALVTVTPLGSALKETRSYFLTKRRGVLSQGNN